MSSMFKPASAIAASQAATVSDSGGTISRRPISDMPMPVSATLSSNFSGSQHGPHVLTESLRFDLVDRQRGGFGAVDEAEQRQPDVVVLLEDHLDLLTQLQLLGVAVDDVGGQPDSRVFGDRDLRDDVGRGQAGQAESFVDGEPGQRRATGHRPHAEVV